MEYSIFGRTFGFTLGVWIVQVLLCHKYLLLALIAFTNAFDSAKKRNPNERALIHHRMEYFGAAEECDDRTL